MRMSRFESRCCAGPKGKAFGGRIDTTALNGTEGGTILHMRGRGASADNCATTQSLMHTPLTLLFAVGLLVVAGCNNSRRTTPSSGSEGRNPGECSDGADNDGDGFFDCDDTDCARAPVCLGDAAVTIDSGSPDSGRDGSPRDATPDTRPRDSSVDTGPRTCTDASGLWENVVDCEFFPLGAVITITRTGTCTYAFESETASGSATVDGSNITINVTTPLPTSCVGTLSGGVITTMCLGCDLEFHRF
jgi:hypothetical protein